MISFEDLAELDDEQLDDDITDNSEPMDDDDQDRLLAHWQAVGRTHQVSVPRGTEKLFYYEANVSIHLLCDVLSRCFHNCRAILGLTVKRVVYGWC